MTTITFDSTVFDHIDWDAHYGTLTLHVGPIRPADVYDVSEQGDPLRYDLADGREVLIGLEVLAADARVNTPGGIEVTLPDGHVMRSPDVAEFLRRQTTTAR